MRRTVRLQIGAEVHEGRVLLRPREVLVAYRGQTYAFGRPGRVRSRARSARWLGHGQRADAGHGAGRERLAGDVASSEGESLGVMEAMKMELALKAPFAGVVTEVDVAAADQRSSSARGCSS